MGGGGGGGGRQSLSTRSFQVAVIPLYSIRVCNSHFENLLGEITRLHVDDGVYES